MIMQQDNRDEIERMQTPAMYNRAPKVRAGAFGREDRPSPIGNERKEERAAGLNCRSIIGHAAFLPLECPWRQPANPWFGGQRRRGGRHTPHPTGLFLASGGEERPVEGEFDGAYRLREVGVAAWQGDQEVKMIMQQDNRDEIERMQTPAMYNRAPKVRAGACGREDRPSPIGNERKEERAAGLNCPPIIGHAAFLPLECPWRQPANPCLVGNDAVAGDTRPPYRAQRSYDKQDDNFSVGRDYRYCDCLADHFCRWRYSFN